MLIGVHKSLNYRGEKRYRAVYKGRRLKGLFTTMGDAAKVWDQYARSLGDKHKDGYNFPLKGEPSVRSCRGGLGNTKNTIGESGYRGVCNSGYVAWFGYEKKDGKAKRVRIGTFDTAEDAARAYDQYVRSLGISGALYNFPEPGEASARKQVR